MTEGRLAPPTDSVSLTALVFIVAILFSTTSGPPPPSCRSCVRSRQLEHLRLPASASPSDSPDTAFLLPAAASCHRHIRNKSWLARHSVSAASTGCRAFRIHYK